LDGEGLETERSHGHRTWAPGGNAGDVRRAYREVPPPRQSLTLLLRDFVAMIERHNSPWHGQRLAECARQVMAAYAEREAGRISHEEMVQRLAPVRQRTHERLTWAAKGAPAPKTRGMAKEILKVEEHLWTFLSDPAIPVTNNLRERLLRYAVIWRKLSYGTDSEAGARFVERILTVTASLQLQQRDVFGYLATAIDAHFHGQPAPSILPITSDSG
jgi:transposase